MTQENSILVIGYGNPGRQDDGLGPNLISRLAHYSIPGVVADSQYQLSAEDALRVIQYQHIVFVDASMDMTSDFRFEPLRTGKYRGFGSHSLAPEAVMDLANTLYGITPIGYQLAIRGQSFDDYEEKLSAVAEQNLDKALAFLISWLKHQVNPRSSLKTAV